MTDDMTLVKNWRAALVRQMLTPAPDVAAVIWKKATLASKRGRGYYGFTTDHIELFERSIAGDLKFLAAHPTKRRSNQEAP